DANYNSLEASLMKRLSGDGGTSRWGASYFTLAYTYAKSIDTASGFRNTSSRVPYYNHALFRAVSDYDIPQRFTLSGGWDLPFNELANGFAPRLTKGWSIYPIMTARAGFPIDIK